MIKLYIVDDHKIIRDGIKAMVKHFEDIIVIGEASNGEIACEDLSTTSLNPDVILLDINMPMLNGIQTTEKLLVQSPNYHILAISMNHDTLSISKMLKAGALGYILKDSGEEELLEAIRTVANGNTFFSKEVAFSMMSTMVKKNTKDITKEGSELSKREIEVLQLIANGFTNKEIGEQLFISPRTVDTHRRNLLQKTGVKNSAGLVNYASKKGYI